MLPDHVSPSRLIAAREADETAALCQMVDDRGLLRHAHRILSAHHVAHLADADILGDGSPVGVEHPRIRTAFVALGPEVMLDSGDAPQSEVIGGANDVVPAGQSLLVTLAVAPDGPQGLAFGLIGGGNHRIKLKYYFKHCRPLKRLRFLGVTGTPLGRQYHAPDHPARLSTMRATS